jgi:dimethylhistidine N-methyltransferase
VPTLREFQPETESVYEQILRGLCRPQKEIPCKFLYDERGSRLFEQICELDEYYLTRTELAITREHAAEMASLLGERCLLIEYGSGSSLKTRILLEHLREPAAYVPVDISKEHLQRSAQELVARYPKLSVLPVCADYTADYELPRSESCPSRRAVYFPGSTIGNFTASEAEFFLKHIASLCGAGGALLIGVDLVKARKTLERAYDDSEGVTAEFMFNLLQRINRELDADFRRERFRYHAFYNEGRARIEMYLVSLGAQRVRIGETEIHLAEGEPIRTEYSHKFSLEGFRELAAGAGLEVRRVWTDPQKLFSVQYLTVG